MRRYVMKKLMDALQMMGIMMATGIGAMIGFVGGALLLDPDCKLTLSNNKSKESE